MATKPRKASEKVKAFVAESSIPGSDANELDLVEEKLAAERQQRALLELRLNAVNDRIDKLKAQQRELCPHHATEDDSHYYSGSYNDRAETTHNLKCTRCGHSVKKWTVTHSWYG